MSTTTTTSIPTPTNGPPAKKSKSSLPTIRIGGVPEHFNYPLHMVKDLGLDTKNGVNLVFAEQACGTGQMITNLKSKSVDLIVALTEGITADIAKGGSDVRILGTYVASPLCWAISGSGDESSGPKDVAGMRGKTFGISRPGSGSQLMAYVLALERGWNPQEDVKFQVVGNFQQVSVTK
jgi:ABC-type nitrate/sulfonate/bicarbonate transport system substrate-binding protein